MGTKTILLTTIPVSKVPNHWNPFSGLIRSYRRKKWKTTGLPFNFYSSNIPQSSLTSLKEQTIIIILESTNEPISGPLRLVLLSHTGRHFRQKIQRNNRTRSNTSQPIQSTTRGRDSVNTQSLTLFSPYQIWKFIPTTWSIGTAWSTTNTLQTRNVRKLTSRCSITSQWCMNGVEAKYKTIFKHGFLYPSLSEMSVV